MIYNPIKIIRNPNSLEAIQARLSNLPDPTNFRSVQTITNSKASKIFIDLTKDKVDQSINSVFFLNRSSSNKRLVRVVSNKDANGYNIMTLYYLDSINKRWVIVRGYVTLDKSCNRHNYILGPVPRATYPNTFGFYGGIPGEMWLNEGRSIKSLREAQKRIFSFTEVVKGIDQNTDHPEDRYENDPALGFDRSPAAIGR